MSFAKVAIVGHLGRDPESRYLQSGTLVVSFTIAASGRRRSGGEPGTTWFRVSAFGEQAERLANMVERGYITKGKMLYVEGQLEQTQFQGNDGQPRTSLEVTMSDWQFIGSNQQNQGQGQGGASRGGYGSERANDSQDSGSSYGGSNYGNEFNSGDDASDLNEVPF